MTLPRSAGASRCSRSGHTWPPRAWDPSPSRCSRISRRTAARSSAVTVGSRIGSSGSLNSEGCSNACSMHRTTPSSSGRARRRRRQPSRRRSGRRGHAGESSSGRPTSTPRAISGARRPSGDSRWWSSTRETRRMPAPTRSSARSTSVSRWSRSRWCLRGAARCSTHGRSSTPRTPREPSSCSTRTRLSGSCRSTSLPSAPTWWWAGRTSGWGAAVRASRSVTSSRRWPSVLPRPIRAGWATPRCSVSRTGSRPRAARSGSSRARPPSSRCTRRARGCGGCSRPASSGSAPATSCSPSA